MSRNIVEIVNIERKGEEITTTTNCNDIKEKKEPQKRE